MKISEKEARVLACMQLQADKPVADVSKETGLQAHTIRYNLRNLVEKGVTQRIPFINIMHAGYQFLGIYFSVLPEGAKDTAALVARLREIPEVVWLAELGGDFQYGMSLCVGNLYQVEAFLSALAERFPKVFGNKAVELQFSVTRFSRGYLHQIGGKKFTRTPIRMQSGGEGITLDDTDKKVLGALTGFPNESMRTMAQKSKIPLSTFELRMRKLTEKKILLGHLYELNPAAIGRQIHKITIATKSWQSRFYEQLIEHAAQEPCAVALYSGIGSWDFELNIEVADAAEVSRVTSGLLQRFGDMISSLKVMPKFRDIKHVLVPF